MNYLHMTISLGTNQLEDPRQEWKNEQMSMLKNYLKHAEQDLQVSKYSLTLPCLVTESTHYSVVENCYIAY